MQKPELLLPAGNDECLRAAVNNGADAVYFGLNKFNARESASNFTEERLPSIIDYCHKRGVKAYAAFNTLVKNSELEEYFRLMGSAYAAGADGVIIQDLCFIPIIKKNFPNLPIHLSTQATITNSFSVPEGVERVILPREMSLDDIKEMSAKFRTEVFVHGALCFSYSGQCLFSSMAGGRSGNRGKCAQPCRKVYNNKYLMSTMDLCMLEKIPELISAGVASFKIEGRLRSPLYVATAAKIYRKYIDRCLSGKFHVGQGDMDELMVAFNREFTQGFAFTDNILDTRKPMNRGIYIGQLKDGKITLRHNLKLGDGIGIWLKEDVIGQKVNKIIIGGKSEKEALAGDTINLPTRELVKEEVSVYKTSSVDSIVSLGDGIREVKGKSFSKKIELPKFAAAENDDKPSLFVKVYSRKSAIEADEGGADIIYYDILKDDFASTKRAVRNALFFAYTPRILSDSQVEEVAERIKRFSPDGILIANRGLLKPFEGWRIHLDQSFNCFNDIDMQCYSGIPIISPELNFKEATEMKNKRFIVQVQGDIVVMTTKCRLKAPELIDEEERHFKVREYNGLFEITNYKQMGLFSRTKEYIPHGIKYFYMNLPHDAGKFVRIYKKVIELYFDDKRIRKGYTKGHFDRGVE